MFPRFEKYNCKSKIEHEHEQIHGIETKKRFSAHWLVSSVKLKLRPPLNTLQNSIFNTILSKAL